MTTRNRCSRAASLLAVVAAVLIPFLAAAPAQANQYPGGGGPCDFSVVKTHGSATSVTFNFTISCNRSYYQMYNGMTIQRPGKTYTMSHTCRHADGTPLRKCQFSVTYSDPAGSQEWQIYDEWIYQYTPYDSSGDSGMFSTLVSS
jgi:hypothetical protein